MKTIIWLLLLRAFAVSATIDEQIMEIHSADKEQRVRLVNEFKINLSTLSEQGREAAITKLRATMQGAKAVQSAPNAPMLQNKYQNGAMQKAPTLNQIKTNGYTNRK